MSDERCDYCGSTDVRGWQGNAKWCSSDRCWQRHQFATCEPNFLIYFPPTPIQRFAARVADAIVSPIARITPAWFVYHPNTLRGRLSLWIYARSYWLAEVAR